MATNANQSQTVDAILDAFQAMLEAATGFQSRRVVEWNGSGGRSASVEAAGAVVWFRWLTEELDGDSGAGRYGTRENVTVEVSVTTRGMKDGSQRDKKLARAHLAIRYLVVNAASGRVLYSAYDAAADGEPPMPAADGHDLISIAPMKVVKLPAYDRPRPEQGFVETRVGIEVPCVLRVTLNDVPEADA